MNSEKDFCQITPEVSCVSALDDNYIWFIHGLAEMSAQKQIIIVDPGDAQPVIDAIEGNHYQPQALFITHHHYDHTGGIDELISRYHIPVYGPDSQKIAQITEQLVHQQSILLTSMGLSFSVLEVPGHTLDHIAYSGHNCLFIGDTLFAGGCGRLFEGTAMQMHHSLSQLLLLDDKVHVYCAHEYTQENLQFAQKVEPDNLLLQQRVAATAELRANNQATVPSSLGLEKHTNPFLRFDDPQVKTAAEQFAGHVLKTPAAVFETVRNWKDSLD